MLLCWTTALARALRATDIGEAFTVRELAAELVMNAGIDLQDGAPPSAWTSETWDAAPLYAAADALDGARVRFDAVVIDEAQDLSPNDWELVRSLAEGRPLWGFADDGQGFWSDRHVPKETFGRCSSCGSATVAPSPSRPLPITTE